MKKRTLIYIYGLGRSGSTLIGQVLGGAHNSICVGEFASFTTYDELEGVEVENVLKMPCGCGKATLECPENPLNKYLKKYELFRVRKWYSNFAFFLPKEEEVKDYLHSLLDIYENTDSEIIIDTSKNPRLYLSILRSETFKDWDVKGVFVYRDIRKVWRSWRSEKGYLKKKSVYRLTRHLIGHFFWCVTTYLYLRGKDQYINFDEFRKHPKKFIDVFNNQFGLQLKLNNREVEVHGVNHEVAGNPSKLSSTNVITIR